MAANSIRLLTSAKRCSLFRLNNHVPWKAVGSFCEPITLLPRGDPAVVEFSYAAT